MFGNIAPFFTNWGPASATQGGILTASAQQIGGDKTFMSGLLALNNATKNRINFGANGTGSPAFNTPSNGEKVTLSSYIDATHTNDALGSSSTGPWISMGRANNAYELGIFGGITKVYALQGDGSFISTAGSAPGITLGASGTKITQIKAYSQTITPASVAANTTAEQTFTVTGLTTADKVTLNPGAAPTAGTGIVGVRVSAADTLAVTYSNNTAGALTPVSSTCLILATRS